MLGQEFICIFALFPSAYLSPLWRQIAASIVEAHHPGVSGVEIRNFEIGITALQTHTQTRSERVWWDLCVREERQDSRSVFGLARSTEWRYEERRQDIIHWLQLSPATGVSWTRLEILLESHTSHWRFSQYAFYFMFSMLTKLNQTELIIIVLSHTNRAKFCLNLIGHQALK